MASKTLRAGINTFVEKPMTSSVKEGEELIKVAEASGKILTVGFIERFNPAISELKKMTKEGSARQADTLRVPTGRTGGETTSPTSGW